MRTSTIAVVVTIAAGLFASCISGDEEHAGSWYRGNLHTHSFWSDGDDFPESILTWYRDNGYHFVAISDHNTVAAGDMWLAAGPDSPHRRTAERYVRLFDEDWVEAEQRGDTLRVRLKTFEEYSGRFNEPGSFLVVRSEEITDHFSGKPIHLNATNVQSLIPPQGGDGIVDVLQNNVDAVLEQRDSLGTPIMPHINHPNFGWAIRAEQLAAIEGERFFEIYNGHPAVNNNGDSLRMGMERMWDVANHIRLTDGKPVMYGIAVDDAHNYHDIAINRANVGRGWVEVLAEELTPAALIESMEAGKFYASTGVELESVSVSGRTIDVRVAAEEGVTYVIEFIGTERDIDEAMEVVYADDGSVLTTRFAPEIGRVLHRTEASTALYRIPANMLYVRARVTSSRLKRNPYSEGELERAWTQPITETP